MRNTYIIDSSIDITAKEKYELSIQLMLDGLSFSIKDTINNKIVALAEYQFSPITLTSMDNLDAEIRKLYESEKLLQNKNYKKVDLVYITDKQSLIPEEFYDTNSLKTLFTAQNEITENEELLSNYIKSEKAYLVFAFPGLISHFLYKKFPQINIYHQSTIILNNIVDNKNKSTLVAIKTRNKYTTFALKENNRTILVNTYPTSKSEDILYYISAIADGFNLQNKEYELLMNIEKGEIAFDKLSQYVNVNTIEKDLSTKYHKKISSKERLRNYYIL